MPTSDFEQIPIILNILVRLKPESLLDIGIGFGKYGFLAREYLEIWDSKEEKFGKFSIRIDGVEPFPDYITPCHKFIYNTIYTEPIEKIVHNLDTHYDVVLMIDVIEHIEKATGFKVLNTLLTKADTIIIATPKVFVNQEDVFGNPYETHKSHWKIQDFRKLKTRIMAFPNPHSLILAIGKNLWKLKRYRLKLLLKRFLPFI